MTRRRVPVIALVAWTLFVWVSRLRNVIGDDDLNGAGIAWRVAAVVVFCGLAVTVIFAMRTGRPALRTAVIALAGWTTVFWLIRGTGIMLDDHETSFMVVHTVLMIVSIGLSVWAVASVRSPAPDDSADLVAH